MPRRRGVVDDSGQARAASSSGSANCPCLPRATTKQALINNSVAIAVEREWHIQRVGVVVGLDDGNVAVTRSRSAFLSTLADPCRASLARN